jgi:hypothetical protein
MEGEGEKENGGGGGASGRKAGYGDEKRVKKGLTWSPNSRLQHLKERSSIGHRILQRPRRSLQGNSRPRRVQGGSSYCINHHISINIPSAFPPVSSESRFSNWGAEHMVGLTSGCSPSKSTPSPCHEHSSQHSPSPPDSSQTPQISHTHSHSRSAAAAPETSSHPPRPQTAV